MRLKIKPTYKQHLAYEALKEYNKVFLGGGAGGGKSWAICESRLMNCYRYPGYKSFIGREELKRLMSSTYLTWCKVCKHHNIPKDDWRLNGQYNFIEFKNGSRIDLLDLKYLPSDPLFERFGSMEYTDGAIEETGEIHFGAYDVLKSRINRHMNDELGLRASILLTGNPKRNWTYTTFYLPWKNGTLPADTIFIQSLFVDNPYTAKEYSKQLNDITDHSTKQRLMFGNWDYEDDPTCLLDAEDIFSLTSNIYVNKGQKYIIADIARYGSDRAIVTVWDGLQLIEYITYPVSSTIDLQNAITALRIKHAIPITNVLVDEDGVGGGIVDSLRCRGFMNNGRPQNQAYQNMKSECGYKLAEMIRQIWINCDMPEKELELIHQELAMLKTYDADKDGKLRILPKEKIKEAIGRSPDWMDVFIMRMYYELSKSQIETKGWTA
jgi:hypothetical protein